MEQMTAYPVGHHYVFGGVFMCREKSTKKILGFVSAVPPNTSNVHDTMVSLDL